MNRLFVCWILIAARGVLIAAALFLPPAAWAHGVDIFDVTGQAGVRTVRFGYTDGESMLFAQVKVYPPSTPDATVQESMTDRDGYFSFVPFEKGDWRLTAEDGMGHRGEIVITVADGAAGTMPGEGATARNAASSRKLPMPAAIALGLSLILNVFAFYRFALKKNARGMGGADKKDGIHAH
jgi:nickel transport protein